MDQKKTKRMVRLVAILAGIAFVGVLPVVLIIIIVGGGDSGPQSLGEQIEAAESQTRQTPRDADAWDGLASLYREAQRTDDAVNAGERAVRLAPNDEGYLENHLIVLNDSGQTDRALTEAQRFTRANPESARGFRLLGDAALTLGRRDLARLSFQTVIGLDPTSSDAEAAQQGLAQLNPTPTATAPTTPTATTPTSTEPITP